MGNETMDTGLGDFEAALFGDDYQTETENDAEAFDETEEHEDDVEDSSHEDDNAAESEENGNGTPAPENGENPASKSAEPSSSEQKFTIKVNHQEKELSLEEMTALAQQGLDYERVKDQSAQRQKTIESLQAEAAKYKDVLGILGTVAEKSGSTLEQLAESLYVNFRKNSGVSEDAAREELKSARLERELQAVKEQQSQKQNQEKTNDADARMRADVDEFMRLYPDVKLTNEIVEKLAPDIKSGMSLSAAYRKMEKAQSDSRIAELERQLAAKEKNDKNRRNSPGSQQDSGGRRGKSDFDVFERALFG